LVNYTTILVFRKQKVNQDKNKTRISLHACRKLPKNQLPLRFLLTKPQSDNNFLGSEGNNL